MQDHSHAPSSHSRIIRHSPQTSRDASKSDQSSYSSVTAQPTMQTNYQPRDASLPRGRQPIVNGTGYGGTGNGGRAASAQRPAVDTASRTRDPVAGPAPGPIETTLRRQNSATYGHHRQTSVIHGLQHSRNPSFNSPSTSSPLSPESLLHASTTARAAAATRRLQPSTLESTPTNSSPLSPFTAHSSNMSLDAIAEPGVQQTTARPRNGTSRTRRGHNQSLSNSYTSPEPRTPGEYALHHLFHSFVVRADAKIAQCLATLDVATTPVEQSCGAGSDLNFDQLIDSLGHISRQNPKPLVDSLMLWRKNKGDYAAAVKKQVFQQQSQSSHLGLRAALPRRNTESDKPPLEGAGASLHLDHPTPSGLDPLTHQYNLADKGATVSVYILCRVLIAIFEQSTLAAITSDLASKLEDIVFSQLRDVNPAELLNSSIRLANWRVFGQVLGHMSRLDFENVTSRFTSQIAEWQDKVTKTTTTAAAREFETRIELLLLAMRNLQFNATDGLAPIACRFLTELGNLFADAHGPRIKQAYCQLLERLLIPVASSPECFQKSLTWKDFIYTVNSRLGNMLAKVRHWESGFPLSILLICISPSETFANQWLSSLSALAPKLKDKSTRGPAMQAICQLLWTYLVRVADPPVMKLRRVEEVIRLAFPLGKKSHLTIEAGMSDALLQLIRTIGFAYLDVCFRSIIFPLINLDTIQSSRDLKIEHMEPERIVIGIRGFLATIADLEADNVKRPSFPVFSYVAQHLEGLPTSPISFKPEFFNDASRRSFIAKSKPSAAPVNATALSENARQYYFQFCEILGKITILCDNAFGGQASLNEKFSTLTPKTPLTDAFSLTRIQDGGSDQKQLYLELLHVAIQALPRCFTEHIPLTTLINLLCTGSAHVDPSIATSAAESLKAVAKQGYAQAVAIAFPRFIFNYDMQYSTMSDEGRLGPAHIEATLALYLELLNIWTEQVKRKARGDGRDRSGPASARAVQMEMTNVITLVDEIEAYGLFFLCSQSRRVRSYAVRVLRLVTLFDQILGKDEQSRIINILEANSSEILKLPEESLNVAERSRLQKDRQKTIGHNTLIDISGSDNTYDATLWFKAFPNLVRLVFEKCPHAIALCRPLICDRLLLVQNDVESVNKMSAGNSGLHDIRAPGRSAATPAEVLVDQWKLYLIMACVTLNSSGAQSQSQLANAAHIRKTSKGVTAAQEKLGSARALFSAVIPMLSAGPDAIRNAVVLGLGSINRKQYRTLLESLQYAVITCNDEAKARINAHNRTPSSPQRSHMTDRLRTEVAYVYKLTASFLKYADIVGDEWIVNNLVTYTRDLRIFLSDSDVQGDWRFNRLRYHYCGLIEEVFGGTRRTVTPSRWMPFEARKSAFALMEEWCGFPSDQSQRHGQGHSFDTNGYSHLKDSGDRLHLNANVEKEKSNLRLAALSSMAALCEGPVRIKTDSNAVLAFNIHRMLTWIESLFNVHNDKVQIIGRRALRLLLLNNMEESVIMEYAIECCYRTEDQKALESYFDVVAEVLIQDPKYPVEFWRILGTVVFTLGSESRSVRMKSAKLLRTIDERQQTSSNLQEFDISISDKTRAVYKMAQFEYSRRLAQARPHLAFMIVSEFCLHYQGAQADHRRQLVAAILPWIQVVELQVDPATKGPTAESYMLLANLFEITIGSIASMHNEIQALWQALATGPHGGNVQLVLDFIIFLCLERREQNFVEYAKQIIVYLANTAAGARVREFFLIQLTPKNMVNDKKSVEVSIPDTRKFPYTADLNEVLPTGNKQSGLSLGQVALIFLVDLMVPPLTIHQDQAIKLIHALFVLWDHYTPTVQEQAREMLVHLLHELVATTLPDEQLKPIRHLIEDTVDAVRGNQEHINWSYDQPTTQQEPPGSSRVPETMTYLTKVAVDIFSLVIAKFSDSWAKEALHWASICPVRHLACRSFQIFRCISVTLDAKMLADMLARLSNTIADEQSDYQTFSLEILTTLKVIIGALEPAQFLRYPQLFWTTCACLSTIHEREFFETLGMLEKLLEKLNPADPSTAEIILKAQPAKWEGDFEGIQTLLYKGLRSADSYDRTVVLLEKLASCDDCELIGAPDRLLYTIWANLPAMLEEFETESTQSSRHSFAAMLAAVCTEYSYHSIATVLRRFAAQQYQTSSTMLAEMIAAIKMYFFPKHDAQSLIFMMGLLMNRTPWFRVRVMDILCELIPHVDMKDAAITGHGPDLISPLLRLLQTEHCTQALQVMDYIMEVSGNPLERHHIRMSMVSGPSRAIRKEYERTKSLYGIPMSSGWSIPMPAIYSSMTRNNVHAVFYTCGDSEAMQEAGTATPDVEFHQDDGYADSYFPQQSRAGTMRSMETTTDANLSDLVNTLDSLDDFFDELDQDTATTPTGTSHSSYVAVDMHDGHETLYDQQTAPILHRSLNRTSSSLSFQTGFAEQGTHHRAQVSISSGGHSGSLQTSFSSIDEMSGPGPSLPNSTPNSVPNSTKKPNAPPPITTAQARPGLHARSITSPANQFQISLPTAGPILPFLPQGQAFPRLDETPYFDDAVLSDTEYSPFPPLSATLSNSNRQGFAQTPTSTTESGSFTIQGMRRGMRRLTGGKSESTKEKEKIKDAARLRALSGGGQTKDGFSAPGQSPKVPRVPLEYLNANLGGIAGPVQGASPQTSPGL